MLFRDRVGTEPYVVGQMPIKGEKKKKKKTRSPDLQEIRFYSLPERTLSVRIKRNISLDTRMIVVRMTKVTTY